MTVSEIHHRPLSQSLKDAISFRGKALVKENKKKLRPNFIEEYLKFGGLPGVFLVRQEQIRAQRFETQLETILERDLRLLLDTSLSYATIRTVLKTLAMHQGTPLSYTDLMRATRVSTPTLKKLILIFEALFLVRTIPTFQPHERTLGKPVIFLEDQGEATYLIGSQRDPIFDLTRFLYANLRDQLHYRPDWEGQIFQYRTRSGSLVPLCFKIQGKILGIIPIPDQYPTPQAVGSASSFIKNHPGAQVIYAIQSGRSVEISPHQRVVPVEYLL